LPAPHPGREALTVVVDFESEQARFWWTYDAIEQLQSNAQRHDFDGWVWKSSDLPSYSYDADSVVFPAPAGWLAEGAAPATFRFQREEDATYSYTDEARQLRAVRADTPSHVILSGRWYRPGDGSGVFLAVLPVRPRPEKEELALRALVGDEDVPVGAAPAR
jgi:hypothetical protein